MTRAVHATDHAATFLARLPKQRHSFEAGGQLLYLLATGTVVLPYQLSEQGWHCAVVTLSRPVATGVTTVVTDLEIETALPVHPTGPDLTDPDTFKQVWQARCWQNGARIAAAEALAEMAGDTLTVDMDTAAQRRLCNVTRLHPVGLQTLLTKLVTAGLLSYRLPTDPAGIDVYTLTVPPSTF